MSILRANKMRPVFQEAIVGSPVAQFQKNRCQMKDIDTIFQMIPYGSVYFKLFGHHSPVKLSIFF